MTAEIKSIKIEKFVSQHLSMPVEEVQQVIGAYFNIVIAMIVFYGSVDTFLGRLILVDDKLMLADQGPAIDTLLKYQLTRENISDLISNKIIQSTGET